MFDHGLVDEVAAVAARFGRDAKALEGIGYHEALMVVEGKLSRAEAIAFTQLHTRQYAKRQITWFRRETGVVWLATAGNLSETKETAFRLASERIKNIA
jgi:tRNA dimethylallyltransferase